MALYSDIVMDHFRNPRNVGSLPDANGIGEVGNAQCGDIMKIYLKINNDIIEDVKFETFGCASAIASSSLDGLPAHKVHCSVLAKEAIEAAVNDYYEKQGESKALN